MTTIQDRIKTVLTNYGSCLNNIGFDEFPSILSITFGNRDKDKREIDDLSDKATKKIVDLIKEVQEETRKEMQQEIAELKIKVIDLTNHCRNL